MVAGRPLAVLERLSRPSAAARSIGGALYWYANDGAQTFGSRSRQLVYDIGSAAVYYADEPTAYICACICLEKPVAKTRHVSLVSEKLSETSGLGVTAHESRQWCAACSKHHAHQR